MAQNKKTRQQGHRNMDKKKINKKTRQQGHRNMDMNKIEDEASEPAILVESPDGRIYGYGNPNVKTIVAQYIGPKTWCYTKYGDDNDNKGYWWEIIGLWREEIEEHFTLLEELTTSLNAKVAELDKLIKSLSLV